MRTNTRDGNVEKVLVDEWAFSSAGLFSRCFVNRFTAPIFFSVCSMVSRRIPFVVLLLPFAHRWIYDTMTFIQASTLKWSRKLFSSRWSLPGMRVNVRHRRESSSAPERSSIRFTQSKASRVNKWNGWKFFIVLSARPLEFSRVLRKFIKKRKRRRSLVGIPCVISIAHQLLSASADKGRNEPNSLCVKINLGYFFSSFRVEEWKVIVG